MTNGSSEISAPVIGLIPAAGHATRLGPLPFSKELYPVDWVPSWGGEDRLRVRVVAEGLLDQFRDAQVDRAYLILRRGKWDIPDYLGDGSRFGVPLAYLVTPPTDGVPHTLDRAYPFVRHARVALGFPDVLYAQQGVYERLLTRQAERKADLVLGLFPAAHPEKMDMVALDAAGRPLGIDIKPRTTALRYTWLCAVWGPRFSSFLHEVVQGTRKIDHGEKEELFVGHLFQEALHSGFVVEAEIFPGECLDLGTPDVLAGLTRRAREESGIDR